MSTELKTSVVNGIVQLHPQGRFDFEMLDLIMAAIDELSTTPGDRLVVLDLSEVKPLTSSGIGVIVKLHDDYVLAVVCTQQPILELLELAGITKLMRMHDSLDTARQTLFDQDDRQGPRRAS